MKRVDKAVDCIGICRNALRPLPTDANFQARIDALEEAIAVAKSLIGRNQCVGRKKHASLWV